MKNDTLAGTLVLVLPDMEESPETKRGHIGALTYARSETENYVRFPDGGEANYPARQVMMLKDKHQVCDDLTHHGSSMPLNDFKAMYKIMLLQDKGLPRHSTLRWLLPKIILEYRKRYWNP